jgi:hypothetical protein
LSGRARADKFSESLTSPSLAVSAYARTMLWFLLIVVLGVAAYRYRVKILAKVLGQPEGRIERQIGRKKNY